MGIVAYIAFDEGNHGSIESLWQNILYYFRHTGYAVFHAALVYL